MHVPVKKILPAITIVLALCACSGMAYASDGGARAADSSELAASLVAQSDQAVSTKLATQASAKAQKKANRAYYKKLKSYLRKYGQPKRVSDASSKTESATGVAFAKLYNFDRAGTSELVVAYYNSAKANPNRAWQSMPDGDAYYVEVWGYASGRVKTLVKSKAVCSNGGLAGVRMFDGISKKGLHKKLLETSGYTTKNGATTYTEKFLTVKSGKAKVPMKFQVKNTYTANAQYYLNGKRASSGADQMWLDSKLVKYDVITVNLMRSTVTSTVPYPGAGARKSIYYTPSKQVKITKSTIKTLKKA